MKSLFDDLVVGCDEIEDILRSASHATTNILVMR